MKTLLKINTLFLGFAMLMFGLLKFVNPFKTWYRTQIMQSDLPFKEFQYWAGQLGEIAVGGMILYLWFSRSKVTTYRRLIFHFNLAAVIVMMSVAVHVHLLPSVPADVLPLKFRPPVIPAVFIVSALLVLIVNLRHKYV